MPRFARSSVALTVPLVAGALLLTACGADYPRDNAEPSVQADSAQSVGETFVETFNNESGPEAVRRSFCSASIPKYESGDGLPDVVAGSMVLDGVDVKDGAGSLMVSGSTRGGTTDRFTLPLRDDKAQGWCIVSVS